MPHVVIVNDHAAINGGQARIAIDSALWLRRAGAEVSFLAGVGPVDPRLAEAGIPCEVVGRHDIASDPVRLRAAALGLWNPGAARALSRMLRALPRDDTVVHLHGWSKYLSPSIGPVVTRAAHVCTLHEYFLACPNGGFYDHRAGEICSRTALGRDCLGTNCDARNAGHKAWRVARQALLWHGAGLPARLRDILYLSPRQIGILHRYLPAQAHLHHVPNPVEAVPGDRVRAEHNDTILFVGRLSAEKGAEVVARAAAIAGLPIAFAGTGERGAAVRAANPEARMLGWLDPARLDRLMRRARCVVFPSLWYETYGLVVVEALRRGLPVLVSRDCVAADLVQHGSSGFHVETGNPEAWARQMLRLADPGLTRRLSVQAHRAGQAFPDYPAHARQLLQIYGGVLQRWQRDMAPLGQPA